MIIQHMECIGYIQIYFDFRILSIFNLSVTPTDFIYYHRTIFDKHNLDMEPLVTKETFVPISEIVELESSLNIHLAYFTGSNWQGEYSVMSWLNNENG